MATYFGEVLHECSRAFVDDNHLSARPTFKVTIHEESNKEHDYLIISADDVCTGFTTSYFDFKKAKHIASIEEIITSNNEYNKSKTSQTVVAELYQLKQNILLFKCVCCINPFKAHALLLNIVPWVKQSKEVIVLSSNYAEDYKNVKRPNEMELDFCRALKTKFYKSDVGCPLLESPNTVRGFAAAVISWCQFEDLQCVLYIFYYTKQLYLVNTVDISVLLKYCQKLKWYKEIENKSNNDTTNRIKIRGGPLENSNMYL